MTSVKYYRDLLLQDARIEAFRRAIAEMVCPGDVVVDVGTGLGTFAFFAADAGAARVYAVDGDPILHVGRTIARHNGYADRVSFVRGWLPEVELPERADVIVLEDFSPRLLDVRLVGLLETLHRDYAKPGARFVPSAGRFAAAPVSSEVLWEAVTSFGRREERYGIDWSAGREYVTNTPHTIEIAPSMLAAPSAELASMRFAEPATWRADGEATWRLVTPSVIHGLAYWFELELSSNERLSNGPGRAPGSWGHLYLPVDPPLDVDAGIDLTARVGMRLGALWWTVAAGGVTRRGHEFRSVPASVHDILAGSPDYVPSLGGRGELERRVLALADGRRSIREIAADATVSAHLGERGAAERFVVRILKDRIRGDTNGLAPREKHDH